MSPLDDINTDNAMAETGQRSHARRRLSDKILAAFNHAYSVGEHEVAEKLKAALRDNESRSSEFKEMRQSYDPLGEADLWVNFVEARNAYHVACEGRKGTVTVTDSLEAMKEAYRVWSVS